ncbi:MAG TPA: hypothetical protein VD846_11485 [Allosphingosinicella sp.]|nr:hypothetical protein [Allosphingosinicella sp.]
MSITAPRVFSYKVVRDLGFAPNPFYGVCTLACCKPDIRDAAEPGSLVIGTGGQTNGLLGRLIFAMEVAEKLTFTQYWEDERFAIKKADMDAGLRAGYGDNIYHKDAIGNWMQALSHHSFEDGSLNVANLQRDTSTDAVLIGSNFVYWGSLAPEVPTHLQNFEGDDLRPRGRADRSRFSDAMREAVFDWFSAIPTRGYLARPSGW